MLLTRCHLLLCLFYFKSCSFIAEDKFSKNQQKTAKGFMSRFVYCIPPSFFSVVVRRVYVEENRIRIMLIRDPCFVTYTVSIRKKYCVLSRGNAGMLSTFCVVYFTMNEHRSLVLASPSISTLPPS